MFPLETIVICSIFFLLVQISGSVSFGDHGDLHHLFCIVLLLVQVISRVSFGDYRDL